MNIFTRVKAYLDRRAEARRVAAFIARHGDVKCPHCQTWQSHCCLDGMSFSQYPTDNQLDILLCGHCGEQSSWLYGPGVWLYVGDRTGEKP